MALIISTGRVDLRCAQPPDQFQPVHAWQHAVKRDRVEAFFEIARQRLASVRKVEDCVPLLLKFAHNSRCSFGIVLNDQDARYSCHFIIFK